MMLPLVAESSLSLCLRDARTGGKKHPVKLGRYSRWIEWFEQ